MKTTDKSKYQFERKPRYRNFIYFSEVKSSSRRTEDQGFIVPWQMVETKESKYVMQ